MLLSFHIADIIQVPFGYLMEALYRVTGNYGFALMLFAVIVQLVLLPITAKSKKSMMKMSRLTPLAQDIQRRYADDPARQNQAIQELYQKEGVSMGGGCLWSFVPMLLLIPVSPLCICSMKIWTWPTRSLRSSSRPSRSCLPATPITIR